MRLLVDVHMLAFTSNIDPSTRNGELFWVVIHSHIKDPAVGKRLSIEHANGAIDACSQEVVASQGQGRAAYVQASHGNDNAIFETHSPHTM